MRRERTCQENPKEKKYIYIKEGKKKVIRKNEKIVFGFIVFGGESNILTKWKVEVGLEGDF